MMICWEAGSVWTFPAEIIWKTLDLLWEAARGDSNSLDKVVGVDRITTEGEVVIDGVDRITAGLSQDEGWQDDRVLRCSTNYLCLAVAADGRRQDEDHGPVPHPLADLLLEALVGRVVQLLLAGAALQARVLVPLVDPPLEELALDGGGDGL